MDIDTTSFAELVGWLKNPTSYDESTQCVELVETHISCVFLTDRFAYKLKKPVKFEFADFSNSEARREACQDEVRLNRRLTTDVYVGVVPVLKDSQGQFKLAGDGEVVDWLVKMRRLNSADTILERIKTGRLSDIEIGSVVSRLCDFYLIAARPDITPHAYHRELLRHVRANQTALLSTASLPKPQVRRIHQRQLQFLACDDNVLLQRVSKGRIVDGHGDLRPEHIFLVDSPQIIDCIEFSEEYRRLDIADEICFLSMECDRHGASGLASKLIARFQEVYCDNWPPSLVDFYRSYRACVRAKIATLRAAELEGCIRDKVLADAEVYLQLAETYTRRCKPMLILIGGRIGSGKSTLASRLSEELGIDVLSTDVVRRQLFGMSVVHVQYAEGSYRPEHRARVYEELFRRAAEQLAQGFSVILDGTFLSTALKVRVLSLAADHAAAVVHLRCVCPEEVAMARISHRRRETKSTSEARPDLLALQRREEEPDPSGLRRLDVDTTQPMEEQVSQSCAFLAKVCDGRRA
jgi:aminoglycoside phosphotransferase family enzyme/predicted kinase